VGARAMRLALLLGLSQALLRKERSAASLDPYDCYEEDTKGENYPGLADMTKSGRSCQVWLSDEPHKHSYTPADKGIGNHNFCRNPGASKAEPWCYTQDTGKEWEYCKVPKCVPAAETPEAWTAPEGLKSEGAEDCVWVDTRVKYEDFAVMINGTEYDQGACRSEMGSTYWLIGDRFTADDEDDCINQCLQMPGSNFATHWSTPFNGTDCGCYRNCIPTEDPNDGAIGLPKVFKLTGSSLLEEGAVADGDAAAGHPTHMFKAHRGHKKKPCVRKAAPAQPNVWKLAKQAVGRLARDEARQAPDAAFLAWSP